MLLLTDAAENIQNKVKCLTNVYILAKDVLIYLSITFNIAEQFGIKFINAHVYEKCNFIPKNK